MGQRYWVIGGEYRKEKNSYKQDPFVADGFTNGVSIGDFDPDPFKVKELYGEIQVPIMKDEPFFEDLTLSGAGRLSWYGGAIGTVKTYNIGLEWAPVRDLDEATLDRLIATARRLLTQSAGVAPGRTSTMVYRRAGRPCPRCGTVIRSAPLSAEVPRTTYWCPSCQGGS